jgi:hypothetical protein
MPSIRPELIAEYLARAKSIRETSSEEAYIRVNQLAYQLAIELPVDLWSKILRAVATGSGFDAWDAIVAAHKAISAEGELTIETAVWHAPGIGKKSATIM